MNKRRIQLTMFQVASMYAALPNPWEHMKQRGPATPYILQVLNQDYYLRAMEALRKANENDNTHIDIPPMIIYDEIAFMLDTNSKELQWKPSSHIIEIK